jgi:NAD(P)-dependent dehydrogenase (short-subunit alcohol dehydrogenase family)
LNEDDPVQDFTNKVAVVTGAASGIGKALAAKCLDEGMQVVLADIEEAALENTVTEFQSQGKNALLAVRADVSIEKEIDELAVRTLDTFGAVHLLFNNAGVVVAGDILENSRSDWEWVLGVNLWSVIHGVRRFLPIMLAQDCDCHIVNTASGAGLVPGFTPISYTVSKYGVVALSESTFLDLQQRNARVGMSVLCPGLIDTQIVDADRNRPASHTNAQQVELGAASQANLDMLKQGTAAGMPPAEVADIVFQGIREERLYILTHPEQGEVVVARANSIVSGTNLTPIDWSQALAQ